MLSSLQYIVPEPIFFAVVGGVGVRFVDVGCRGGGVFVGESHGRQERRRRGGAGVGIRRIGTEE